MDGMDVYICPGCDSKLLTLTELDKKIRQSTVKDLREAAVESNHLSSIDCGLCGGGMRRVQLPESKIELDICLACDAIWFGGAQEEYEKFLLEELSLKPSTKTMLVENRAGAAAKEVDLINQGNGGFGYGSEDLYRDSGNIYTPHATGYIFFLVLIVSFICFRRPDIANSLIYSNGGSIPRQLLTTFTSFFVHASWSHLLSNLSLYYLVADSVERKLGTEKFLSLLATTAVSCTAFHVISNYGHPIGRLGASAGISALIAYYVSADPYRPIRLSSFFTSRRTFSGNYVVRVAPAWSVLIMFVVSEIFSWKQQMSLPTPIAHSSHLIGVVVGLSFFVLYPPKKAVTPVA